MIWTKNFWKGAAERGLKTWFQSFVAALATLGIVGGASTLEQVPWLEALSIATLATVLSLGTSIGNADFTAGKDSQV